MSVYPIYTIDSGMVNAGASVTPFTLSGAGVTIPAILVGEEGRGRSLGVLPVQLTPHQDQELAATGKLTIIAATLSKTRAGKPKLVAADQPDSNEAAIVVMPTTIGFRGGNEHTGDYYTWRCEHATCPAQGALPMPERCPDATEEDAYAHRPRLVYYDFPGQILASGLIAQGDAGRMGSGDQYVALMPRAMVWRTGYSGRLYGSPSAHYYLFDGRKILSATLAERQASDIF